MRCLLSGAAALVVAVSAATAADRALVIGIDDYSALPGELSLTSAVADASNWTEVLTGPMGFTPDAVTVLTDGKASTDAILSSLIDRLVRETTPGDRIVLTFSGRGTRLSDGTPALIAHDGDAVLGQIPLSTLAEILDVVADRDITVILDTSFDAGPIGTLGTGTVAGPDAAFGSGITLWTAARPGQSAWSAPGRGPFASTFAEAALNPATSQSIDGNGDGTISQGELLVHLDAELADWCSGHAPCNGKDWQAGFSGNPDTPIFTLAAADPPTNEVIDPIIADDGAPASFRETIGFVTDLFAPNNAANLNLSINNGDTLRVGDFVTFTASSERSGTLVLLDVDPMGRLAQVYPSQLSPVDGTRMGTGQTLVIPSAVGANGRPLRIRVTEPAGQGLLLGLFIEDELSRLTDALPAGIAGGPVANAGQSLFQISQALLRLEADSDRPVSWSATYLPYRIEP